MGKFEPGATPYEVAPFEDGPCPVCGAPMSVCRGGSQEYGTVQFIEAKPKDPMATFTVPKRVVESYEKNGRTYKRLLHAKGARIRPEEAERLRGLGLL